MYDLLAIIIGGVDCRIGSLEMHWVLAQVSQRVDCRIGSLEIEVLCAKLIK